MLSGCVWLGVAGGLIPVSTVNGGGPVVSDEADSYIDIQPATKPNVLTAEQFSLLLDLRARYGLNDDPAFVRALNEHPLESDAFFSAKMLVGGMVFSRDEADDVYAIGQLEWAASHISEWAERRLGGEVFAGANVSRRTLAIYCSGCDIWVTAEEVQSLGETVGEGNSVEVVDVKYSLAALLRVQKSVADYLDSHEMKYVGTGVDYSSNSIVVTGPESLNRTLPFQFQSFPLKFEIDETLGVDQVEKHWDLGYNLVEGAQAIKPVGMWGDFTCTSGFAVQSAYGPFIATAGHCMGGNSCGVPGGTWEQGGAVLGVASACLNQGQVDAALISTYGYRNNIGRIHWTSTDYLHAVIFAVSTQNLTGQTVCQTGAETTGLSGDMALYPIRCAPVSTMTFRPACCGDDGLPWSASFLRADYPSAQGDSGAAVVWPTGYGFGAAGLHKSASGLAHWATQFRHVASTWGLTLSPY
jgi:hypothetical protein